MLKVLPVEIIEYIMSFCSGKDLLSLSVTCKTFNGILSDNVTLMRKLKFVLNPETVVNYRMMLIKQELRCVLMNRKYTSFVIKDFGTVSCSTDTKLVESLKKLQEVCSQLEHIESLEIHTDNFTIDELRMIILPVISRVQSLALIESNSNNRRIYDKQLPYESESLVELHITENLVEMLVDSFKPCRNLKKLSLSHISSGFNDNNHWQLEELRIDYIKKFPESLKSFIRRQNSLRKLEVSEAAIGDNFTAEILESPKLEQLKVNFNWSCLNLSSIPLHLLRKVRLHLSSPIAGETVSSCIVYSPDAPGNMEKLEENFILFLRKIPRKILSRIESLHFGHPTFVTSQISISDKFLSNLVDCLPNLNHLELQCAADYSAFVTFISKTGRTLGKISTVNQVRSMF